MVACLKIRIDVHVPHQGRAVDPFEEGFEGFQSLIDVPKLAYDRARKIVAHVEVIGIEQQRLADPVHSAPMHPSLLRKHHRPHDRENSADGNGDEHGVLVKWRPES